MSESWNNMIDLRLARPDRGLIILIRFIVNNACSYQQVLQASSGLCRHVRKWTSTSSVFNTSRPRQNGRHFPDDIFKCIFLNENVWISIRILLKFVPQGPINIIPALVQIMAWCRPGDKPLSETMMPRLLTHTVYPAKYAHGFCFAVLCCGYTLTDFPISIRLTSLALWQSNDCPSASKATLMNMDKYFIWIRSSDNDSTGLWPPRSLHTLGADGHI